MKSLHRKDIKREMNIVISGSSKGLGLELSKVFLSNGHYVIGISRGESSEFHNQNYRHFEVDISSQEKVMSISKILGNIPIDIVINNAGMSGSGRKIEEVENREIQDLLDVNLFGSLNLVRAFLEKLKLGRGKRIINISSRFGSLSFNQEEENRKLKISYSYRISKASQNMLAVCLSNDLADYGIIVDVIHPGSFVGGCGRSDATDDPSKIASMIYQWIESGQTSSLPRMKEIGGREFDW